MSILQKIVTTKRREIEAARQAVPLQQLRAGLDTAPEVRDFFAVIAADGPIKLIAEIKKASPSKGVIRQEFRPLEIADDYQEHGAACLSVLTDETYFQGHLDYLRQVRERVDLPVLRKDFILDEYQLLEARLAGADAVLLIAECLDDCQLRKLHNETIALGMTPLVEFYEPENLDRVLDAGADLIGVNNRNLKTFSVDLEHTVRMRQRIPSERLVVGESGIRSNEDVQLLESAGVQAILVGEHLMSQDDIGAAVTRLMKSPRPKQ